mmetsp:Transcript_15131/g.52436  ORF Transcript_15131/g.52436 Transcript_15131/m.52436 type:complete len:241 (-) Transcript_15131:3-725(-)
MHDAPEKEEARLAPRAVHVHEIRQDVERRARARHGPRRHGHAVRRQGRRRARRADVPPHGRDARSARGVEPARHDALRVVGGVVRHAPGVRLAPRRVLVPQLQGRAHDARRVPPRLQPRQEQVRRGHEGALPHLALPRVRHDVPDARGRARRLRRRRGEPRPPRAAGQGPRHEHVDGLPPLPPRGVPRQARAARHAGRAAEQGVLLQDPGRRREEEEAARRHAAPLREEEEEEAPRLIAL